MIALRTEYEIDTRRAAHDFGPFGLRHATGDRDHHVTSAPRFRRLHAANQAELGIYFLSRLFPDVAGIEDHQIRVLRRVRHQKAERHEEVDHARRGIDSHLTAVG